MKNKTKLRKGDLVRVISGKYKGTQAPILKILTKKNRVELEGITMIKHIKPSQQEQEGGIKKVPASIHISNVNIMDPKNKKEVSKIGFTIVNNKKVRVARNSKAKLG